MTTHISLHRFIREKGTNNFVKFKPKNPKNPFGEGIYLLEDGDTNACVWERPEYAQTFLDAFPEWNCEMVPVLEILKNEFPELIN